jgi:hypothetical protein
MDSTRKLGRQVNKVGKNINVRIHKVLRMKYFNLKLLMYRSTKDKEVSRNMTKNQNTMSKYIDLSQGDGE